MNSNHYERCMRLARPSPSRTGLAHNAILMRFVDDRRSCAPSLDAVNLERAESKALFGPVLRNIDILLAHERVHADLSAYNFLYWKGAIRLIRFPQVISPRDNANAYAISQRDVRRICDHFARQSIKADPMQLSKQIWEPHGLCARVETGDW